jgi:hypothetical protein
MHEEHIAMSHKTAATVAPTIGIDTGKNTLHLIGLDDNGAIVLREKIARGRIAARFANVTRVTFMARMVSEARRIRLIVVCLKQYLIRGLCALTMLRLR